MRTTAPSLFQSLVYANGLVKPKRIQMRTYSEGYFMKKSPLAKDYVAEKSTFTKIKDFLLNIFKK